jgi:serine/threonine protein kinase
MESISKKFAAFYETQLHEHVLLPERITTRYRVKACLFSSSQKEVYQLVSPDCRQPYVLKKLAADLKQANEAEYVLLQSLDHPRIPKAVELFAEGDFSYFIRSYAEGEPLHQLVKAHGTLTGKEITDIVLQLCDTLIYLHGQTPPIIHRDIKPSNVICAPDGRVYLIDFGISRRFNPEATQDTVFIGTLATAPPEQFGYAQTDVRSDIYALGILMIFLSTGRYDRASLRNMPAGLARIAEKCTQFSPKDRYASAAQLKCALLLHKRSLGRKLIKAAAFVLCLAAAFALGRLFPFDTPAFTPTNSSIRATSVARDGAVSFASPLIEQKIRAQLGKTAGEPIMADELAMITELRIVGNSPETEVRSVRFDGDRALAGDKAVQRGDIKTLSDISLLKNLSRLELVYQRISDLSPLESLNLSVLNIEGNFVNDLHPLSGMTALTDLFAGHNPIRDLSPLLSLPRLKRLSLQQALVSDITPLAQMQSLEAADLFDIPCADFSPLVALPALKSVNISDATARDVAVVVGNKGLKEITAHRCGIASLEMFKTLPDLERLELWQNDIKDLSGVEELENLEYLNLNYTPVEDLTPLTKLARLEELSLRQVGADLSPLLQIPTLKKIQCTPDMQSAIDGIAAKAHFSIEVIAQ